MNSLTRYLATTFIVASLVPVVAWTHHNAASHYLLDQSITIKGVVTEFRLINPHVRIYFEVTDDDGEKQVWLAEGNAASVLRRRGWQNDTLEPGTVVTITGAPARDGGNKIDWVNVILEDGTDLRGGNTKEDQFERQLRELDKRARPRENDQETTE